MPANIAKAAAEDTAANCHAGGIQRPACQQSSTVAPAAQDPGPG